MADPHSIFTGRITEHGGEGNDRLTGGPGNDDLRGYGGDDVLTGGAGDDRLAGMAGIDELDGGPGDDTSYGGAGNDRQTGGAGNDRLYGGPGNDQQDGGVGNDRLSGGLGEDQLTGGPGDDTGYGGPERDLISGGPGNDRLYGGPGNDELDGGAGDDLISGGPGNDWLTGGAGADTFRFALGHSLAGRGDVILDFAPGEGDRILLSGFSSKLTLSDVIDADGGGRLDDREITLPGGGIITLRNVGDTELALENIITVPADDAALLALLTGGDTDGATEAVTTDPAPDPTPQGAFSFSVPVSGWGAEAYRVHWGDESAEIAQSRGNRATLAEIERALESLSGVRDVEVTAPGPADITEGTGGRPYRVEILDAAPGVLRVEKGNGKHAGVRTVDDDDAPAPADPGATPGPGETDTGAEQTPAPDPAEQGPLVFEIAVGHPLAIMSLAIYTNAASKYITPPVSQDDISYHVGMAFPLYPDLGYSEEDPPVFTHAPPGKYIFHHAGLAWFNTGQPSAEFDDAKSMVEAALESLPNVAKAEVTFLSDDTEVTYPLNDVDTIPNKWRIELTEGPGGIFGIRARALDPDGWELTLDRDHYPKPEPTPDPDPVDQTPASPVVKVLEFTFEDAPIDAIFSHVFLDNGYHSVNLRYIYLTHPDYQTYYYKLEHRGELQPHSYHNNLKSGLEKALAAFPNVASAKVTTLSAYQWRIELTENLSEAPGIYPIRGLEYRVEYKSATRHIPGGEKSGFIAPVEQEAEAEADPAPVEQGPLVFEIPAGDYGRLTIIIISDWAGYRRGDEDSYHSVEMSFPGTGRAHRKDGKYSFYDDYTPDPCTECIRAAGFTREFDDAKSMVEAALAILPNVASAEVTFFADKWRIELTEGPGGIDFLRPSAAGPDDDPYPFPVRLAPGEHKHYYYPIEQEADSGEQGAGRFQFDAVTSGALTPGVSEMDGADDAGADPVASVPAVDAWPLAVPFADPGGLDLLI